MKHLAACLMLLAAGFIAPQASQAKLIFSDTYHFNAFEHDTETCMRVLKQMQESHYPYSNLNVSSDRNTIYMDDKKYYSSRCFGSGSREFCSKSGYRTHEIYRITCYPDGDVRIYYERPLDDSVAREECMVKSGQPTICNSDSYRDTPESTRNDIARAIEESLTVNREPARAPARAEKVETRIVVYPNDARVELVDSGEIYTVGMALMPGSYHFRVSKPGFETKTFTVKFDNDGLPSPSFLELEIDTASKKKQCEEIRQGVVNDWHPDEKRKLTAEEMQIVKEAFNKHCVPLGFETL